MDTHQIINEIIKFVRDMQRSRMECQDLELQTTNALIRAYEWEKRARQLISDYDKSCEETESGYD